MGEWFEIKVRGFMGNNKTDDKEVTILGRIVRWCHDGIEYEADPKHRQIVLEHFGFDETTRGLAHNGDKADQIEDGDEEPLSRAEAKLFRGLAARINFFKS